MRRVLLQGNRSKLVGFNPHRATLSSPSVSREVEGIEMHPTGDGNFASDPFSPNQPGPVATSTPKRKQGPHIDASLSQHDSISASKLTITQLSQVNDAKKTKWSHTLQRVRIFHPDRYPDSTFSGKFKLPRRHERSRRRCSRPLEPNPLARFLQGFASGRVASPISSGIPSHIEHG